MTCQGYLPTRRLHQVFAYMDPPRFFLEGRQIFNRRSRAAPARAGHGKVIMVQLPPEHLPHIHATKKDEILASVAFRARSGHRSDKLVDDFGETF